QTITRMMIESSQRLSEQTPNTLQQEKESKKLEFKVEDLRNTLSSLEKEEKSLFQIKSFLPQFETLLSYKYAITQEKSLAHIEWLKQRNTLIDRLVELCGHISNKSSCGQFTELFSKWNGQCILGLSQLEPIPNEYSTVISEFQTIIRSELERVHDEKKKTTSSKYNSSISLSF
ncbi:unnamed protein product, partial [marine sediment metagenome]